MDPYVIVGGGLDGAKAAETLRAEGFDGPISRRTCTSGRRCPRATCSREERESARVHPGLVR